MDLIHESRDGSYRIFITTVYHLIANYNCSNWNKNRQADTIRVDSIRQYYNTEHIEMIPGILSAWETSFVNLEFFDGIHRFLAADDHNMTLLVKIYYCEEADIYKEFNYINKAESLPSVYLKKNNDKKRRICENVANYLCIEHRSFRSDSARCHKPNFNRDNVIELICNLDINFDIHDLENILILGLNNLNVSTSRSVKNPKQKCIDDNFYVFLNDSYEIKKFLENYIRTNCSLI